MRLLTDQELLEQAGRSTVENCISIKLLALAVVMAGTGDLLTLRLCRALRRRVGPQVLLCVCGVGSMCELNGSWVFFCFFFCHQVQIVALSLDPVSFIEENADPICALIK